jgi:hypothetical protein
MSITRFSAIALGFTFCLRAVASPPTCPPPKQSAVCESHLVNREKLVNYILDTCTVSRNIESRVGRMPLTDAEKLAISNGARLSDAARVFTHPACAAGDTCTASEAETVRGANTLFEFLLGSPSIYSDAFRNESARQAPDGFLEDPNAQIACLADPVGKPIEAPGAVTAAKANFQLPVRVRGSTDSLFFDKNSTQFASVDKASISSSYGSANTTRSDKTTLVIGYPITDDILAPYNAIPYASLNRNISRPTNKAVSVGADTDSVGVVNAFQWTTLENSATEHVPITQLLTLRPDYLINHLDRSHLLTVGAVYTPIKNYSRTGWYLNDFHLGILGGGASIEPIGDLRADFGHYTQDGDSTKTAYRDYSRVGPRAGFSLVSENPWIPLQLTVTEVYLYSLSGALSRVDYFKSVLSYKLVGKFISLDASYGSGRREDTGLAEHIWSLALSGAY